MEKKGIDVLNVKKLMLAYEEAHHPKTQLNLFLKLRKIIFTEMHTK